MADNDNDKEKNKNKNKNSNSNKNGYNHRHDTKTCKAKLVLSEAWAELSPAQRTEDKEARGFKLDEATIRTKGKV